jgi:hypothetical protein
MSSFSSIGWLGNKRQGDAAHGGCVQQLRRGTTAGPSDGSSGHWCVRDANDRRDFSATQASVLLNGSHFRGFVRQCCAEHVRRRAGFDYDLLLPRLLPTVAGVVLAGRRLPPSVA